jgi:hypothetical protein
VNKEVAVRLNLVAIAAFGLALAAPAGAEVTRILKAELTGAEARRFAVENLIGTMRISSGSGDAVRVVATIHAESQALADSLRFERKTTRRGLPLLVLEYPVEEHREFRYPGLRGHTNFRLGRDDDSWDWGFGRRTITVSDRAGVLLYADLEIEVPRRELEAAFYNRVGGMTAGGISGTLWFDTAGGDVKLDGVSGDVVADTGSGDVEASRLKGSLRCDTGSGDCSVDGFEGDTLSLDTGSGDVSLRGVHARRINADTGSGNVVADGVEMESLVADTGSGDVRLSLPRAMGFELRADLGGGDIDNRIADATPILRRQELVGYRRGDGRVRIDLDTGSGDVVLDSQD